MGFYGSEPFNTATAVFIAAPPVKGPKPVLGTIVVTVTGCAPRYTGGIQLVQNTEKPGLTIDVMGWTGPLVEGCTEYKVNHSFPSRDASAITVVGSNKTEKVSVRVVSEDQAGSAVRAAFAG